jgi:phosphoribosyl 1,2-cyclic phosphate phosphodiesterase
MPMPMCSCKYCSEAPERLRPGLLIETENTALVFDIGPDLRQQLIETGVEDVDGFFTTHCHIDHFGGLPELHQLHTFTNENIKLYGSKAVEEYIEDSYPWVNIDFNNFQDKEKEFGDLTIHSFKVEHAGYMPMQGFSVEKDGKKIVYIPDLKAVPENEAWKDADLLFVDGMYLFKKHVEDDQNHAAKEELRKQIEKLDADRTILVNISEHFNKMTLEEEKEGTEFELGKDFMEIEI